MKKIIATVLVVVMMLGLTSNALALALTAYSTSTTSLYTTSRVRTYFDVTNATFSSYGSATKLTVRAYTSGGSRNSDAKTYQSGSAWGGKAYWDASVSTTDMRGNTDASGWTRVSGDWVF